MEVETEPRASMEFLPERKRPGCASGPRDKLSRSAITAAVGGMADVPRYAPTTHAMLDSVLSGRRSRHGFSSRTVAEDSFGNLKSSKPSLLGTSLPGSTSSGKSAVGVSKSGISSSAEPSETFFFDTTSREDSKYDFNAQGSHPPRGTKRRRHLQDVDGPNTAGLCCKKRRLRADLITSRLSQPFSQPATHILNREGAESGDKRFLKMATSIDAARRIAHLHATSFLRFSVMNRIRKRLGVGRPAAASPARGGPGGSQNVQSREVHATAEAPWKPQSLQVAAGATYWRQSDASPGAAAIPEIHPGERATSPGVPWVSKPAALPRPSTDVPLTRERTWSRIHTVRSPELRPDTAALTALAAADDLEEDSFAFMHPDYDDYDDDPEHVYNDFGAIFRAGSPDPQPAGDEHSYEEYLDELDGISWVTR